MPRAASAPLKVVERPVGRRHALLDLVQCRQPRVSPPRAPQPHLHDQLILACCPRCYFRHSLYSEDRPAPAHRSPCSRTRDGRPPFPLTSCRLPCGLHAQPAAHSTLAWLALAALGPTAASCNSAISGQADSVPRGPAASCRAAPLALRPPLPPGVAPLSVLLPAHGRAANGN